MRKVDDALLRPISMLLLLSSLLAFLLVAERAAAALWQWYMFYGYETKGVITLSLQTAAIFTVSMAVLLIGSLAILRIARRQSDERAYRLAKSAMIISASGCALYWIVALSPLNAWRP